MVTNLALFWTPDQGTTETSCCFVHKQMVVICCHQPKSNKGKYLIITKKCTLQKSGERKSTGRDKQFVIHLIQWELDASVFLLCYICCCFLRVRHNFVRFSFCSDQSFEWQFEMFFGTQTRRICYRACWTRMTCLMSKSCENAGV